jgi:hypothetical protein
MRVQFSLFDHGETADLALEHDFRRLFHRGVRGNRDRVFGHRARHPGVGQVALVLANVVVRQHPHEPALIGDGQMAEISRIHPGLGFGQGIPRRSGDRVLAHSAGH